LRGGSKQNSVIRLNILAHQTFLRWLHHCHAVFLLKNPKASK